MVAAIRRRWAHVRVVVILLPCTFASGREEDVARSVPGVDEVVPVHRLMSLIVRGLPTPGTALLHLGGDLMYAGLLAWRWNLPTWAFQWAHRTWDRWIRGYFVKTEEDARRLCRMGINRNRIEVVGDLIVDAVQTSLKESTPRPTLAREDPLESSSRPSESGPHIAFLPGSRIEEVSGLGPFYLEAAEHIRHALPHARFSLLISPYLEWGQVRRGIQAEPHPSMGGIRGRLVQKEDAIWDLVSAAGTRLTLTRGSTLPVLATADFAVSIPGTKTGEAGCLGCPFLLVLPMNRMERIPWYGVLGLLDWLPMVGRMLKRLIMRTMVDRYIGRVYSQPNLLSDVPVVPELSGFLTPTLVAERVLAFFDHATSGRLPFPCIGRTDGTLGPYSYNGAQGSDRHRVASDLRALYATHGGAADRAVASVAASLSSVAGESSRDFAHESVK